MTQIKTCREIEEEKPAKWATQNEFHLYHHPSSRLTIQRQQADWTAHGDSLHRHETYANVGVYDAEIDATELAKDIVERFMPSFSVFELEYIIPAMQIELDRWQTERSVQLTKHIDTFGLP